MMESKNVLVVGATGGSGRAAVERLLAAGHTVTAFSRHASRLEGLSERLRVVDGDATRLEDVERAVRGQDAVIVTLGITENPLRVRLFGTSGTPLDVRSSGTRTVVEAMRRNGVRRLIVQSSYGVGRTKDRLRWIDRLVFGLLLKPQILDTEAQEVAVRGSGCDWVLAQPVHLTDDEAESMPFASTDGATREWRVSRKQVARFLVQALQGSDYVGQSVALSG